MTNHNALINSELHEPKDVSTATDGTVYTADGAGSGSWEPLFEESSSSLVGSSGVTLSGLGDYAAIWMTTPDYRSASNNDRDLFIYVGDSGGLTTSSVYYSSVWNYNGIISNLGSGAGLVGRTYTSTDTYLQQNNSLMLLNFNKERYTVGYGYGIGTRSQWSAGLPRFSTVFIREQKAYDRIRFFQAADTAADGTLAVMGLKG